MDAKDISDRYGLDDWLEVRPDEVRIPDAIAIAQRAALRVLPVWLAEVEWSRSHEGGFTALPVLRSLLTSGVVYGYPPTHGRSPVKVGDAAVCAAYAAIAAIYVADAASADGSNPDANPDAEAADAVGYAVAAAGVYAADATGYAAGNAPAEAAAWAAVRTDAEAVESGQDPRSLPLWSKDPPLVILEAEHAGLKTLATETGDRDSFWHRWWFAMKRGEPMDWALQRDVALIPEDVWANGAKAVCVEIAKIEKAYLER